MTETLSAQRVTARLVKFAPPPESIIDDARAEADSLIANAKARAAAILAGAEAAAAERINAAEEAAESVVERALATHLLTTRQAFAAELAEIRPMLARMMREGLAKLVGMTCGDDVLLRQIDRMIADIRSGTAISVVVSPADVAVVAGRFAPGPSGMESPQIVVSADPSLRPGRARLATAGVTVEVDIEAQLDLFESLLAGRAPDPVMETLR